MGTLFVQFDGSGYISDGNISWDKDGGMTIKNITSLYDNDGSLMNLNKLTELTNIFHTTLGAPNNTLYILPQNAFSEIKIVHPSAYTIEGTDVLNMTEMDDRYLTKEIFYKIFSPVFGTNGNLENLQVRGGLWTNSYISALGQNSSQGGGSGTSYNRLDTWSSYDSTKSGWVLSALLGNDLNTRLTVLENGVAPISHTHNWSDITNTPTTLNGYGITDAYISNGVIRLGSQSITPITSLAGYATEDWVGSNYASKNHTHAVIINGVSKTISASGSAAIDLGSYLPLVGGTMSNTNVVTNLNADLLDGIHASTLMRKYTVANEVDANTLVDAGSYRLGGLGSNFPEKPEFGQFLVVRGSSDTIAQMYFPYYATRMYVRTGNAVDNSKGSWNDWKNVAFTDSNISGNAGSATKLQTPRTIWGQGFDGSSDVSGNLTFMTGSHGMYGIVPNQSGNWDLSIYTEGQPRLTIKDDGNVGIGTSNPTEKLDVNGTGYFSSYVGIGAIDSNYALRVNGSVSLGSSSTASQVRISGREFCDIVIGDGEDGDITNLYNLSGLRKYIEFDWYTSYWRIGNVRGGGTYTDGFGIVSGANTLKLLVGNNSTRVFSDLSVDYSINASGTIHSTTGIYSEGYVSALGQNTSSDIRLKDVQGDVDLPIDMLANAPSKLFEWKDNKALGTQVGTIAQYWQKTLPQVVHDRGDGYLAMQYDVAALLGVISLAKNVKSHEERIAELEREIEMLNQELETLKN